MHKIDIKTIASKNINRYESHQVFFPSNYLLMAGYFYYIISQYLNANKKSVLQVGGGLTSLLALDEILGSRFISYGLCT